MASIITAGNATNGLSMSSDGTGTLNIKTGTGSGTTAVYVDASQNVGIGTTTTPQKLNITSSGNTYLKIEDTLANGYNAATLYKNDQRQFRVGVLGTVGGFTNGALVVYDETAAAWRMVIDANGRLYLNTTAAVGALPAYQTIVGNASSISIMTLQDTGTTYGSGTQYITFANSSATVAGSVQHNAAGTVNFATSSDARLKENIVDSSNALTVVDAIKVRAFDWKEDNGHVDFGFIAQELQQHYPDAVCVGDNDAELTDPKGTWQVDYGKLTPLLLKAIQELKAELDALKAKVGA